MGERAGKELVLDATFEFEKKRNRPVKYDREKMAVTLQAMKKVPTHSTLDLMLSNCKKQFRTCSAEIVLHVLESPLLASSSPWNPRNGLLQVPRVNSTSYALTRESGLHPERRKSWTLNPVPDPKPST